MPIHNLANMSITALIEQQTFMDQQKITSELLNKFQNISVERDQNILSDLSKHTNLYILRAEFKVLMQNLNNQQ